ncbi:MAG: terpene cyclase/mutase family protein [Mariniblastus sp.]|nr:terpene cyclase/mutase family protein [Mariniblastus sp.]
MFSTPSLQLFLVVGFAVVAFTVMILAMTRWGQTRPIMKCVILSVAAHILLFGYFYGTNLIFQYPAIEAGDSVAVSLIGYETEAEEEPDPQQEERSNPEPWDEFVNQQPLPDADWLARPEIENSIELERETPPVERRGEADAPIDQRLVPLPENEPPTAESGPSLMDNEPVPLNPEAIEFRRRGEGDDLRSYELTHEIETDTTEAPELPGIDPGELRPDNEPVLDQTVREETLNNQFEVPVAKVNEVDDFLPPSPASNESTARPTDRSTYQRLASSVAPVAQPRRLGDGQPIPPIYAARSSTRRESISLERGGSLDTERAVAAALEWLAGQQSADGGWDPARSQAGQETRTLGHDRKGAGGHADTGITALATLAFLGAGHTHLEGKYQVNVQHALEFLIASQGGDGNLYGDAKVFARMYCHSMALLALSEALAVTGDDRLKEAVKQGVQYSVRSQNRNDGGWRYQPGDRGDMSQFGWQVMAMHSASIGGVSVPQETIDRMHMFLHLCTSGPAHGLASYRPGQAVTTTMTAEALVCRYFMSPSVDPETVHEAVRKVMSDIPRRSRVNLYYWYYGTMALFQSGDENWESWNRSLTQTLVPMQIQEGELAGSWPANGLWAGYGGRVYSTAMATLCLEVYYRYTPVAEMNRDD